MPLEKLIQEIWVWTREVVISFYVFIFGLFF